MEPELNKNTLAENKPAQDIANKIPEPFLPPLKPKITPVTTADTVNASGQPMRVVKKEPPQTPLQESLRTITYTTRDIPKPATVAPIPRSALGQGGATVVTDTQTNNNTNAATILKPLRTYERDIAEMVRTHQTSAVSVNIARQKTEEALPVAVRKEKKVERQKAREELVQKKPVTIVVDTTPGASSASRNTLFAVGGVALIAIGIGLIGFFFFARNNAPAPIVIDVTTTPLLPSDETREINISGLTPSAISEQVSNIISSSYQNDTVTQIRFVTQNNGTPVAAPIFFEAATAAIPASLSRAFETRMFAGVYTLNDKHPFYVIDIDSFDKAFEGMLAWEKDMYSDMGTLMRTDTATNNSIGGIVLNTFSDVIIANKDARVLRTSEGNIVILYSFVDEHTLVIADSERAFKEILNRLSTAKLIR